ncbi:pathogenesis-related protein STH-21-like [Tasmannia lanceolata]|uniref:pathogenesis-related protein STH-21-like n=1 Tax=Tasmannia lanceolata TaxID=3420 RepID=UPI0040642F7E
MGVTGFSLEMESPVAPRRMFNAYAMDSHNILPKILPQVVTGAAIIEGDGGVGSLKHFTFSEAIPYTHVKERMDVVDKDNFEYNYTVIEGGNVGTKLISSVYRTKFEPFGNGGCIIKASAEYETMEGVVYTEDDINVGKTGMMGLFKVLEGYLLASPDVCV